MLKNTLIRMMSALVGLALYFWVINMDAYIFKCIVTAISVFMVCEVLHSFKIGFWGIACGFICSVFVAFSLYQGSFELLSGAILFCLFLCALFCIIKHKKIDFSSASAMSFITIYITLTINYLCMIRDLKFGLHYLFIAFISAWISDTGAYFCGCLFGRHKLTTISPKKTVEGALGGIACCAIGGVIFGLVESIFFNNGANYLMLTIVCAIGSIFGQIGDLAASMIKRRFNIKDFSSIMPGHGGITDRFDSVMLTAPYTFYVILLLNYINLPLIF